MEWENTDNLRITDAEKSVIIKKAIDTQGKRKITKVKWN